MNDTGSRQTYTAWWVWGCLIVGVCVAAMVCGYVLSCFGSVTDTEPPVWCGVCDGYVPTYIGSIGDAVVCDVCDSILAW